MVSFFKPPAFPDEDKTHSASVLYACLNFEWPLVALYFLYSLVTQRSPIQILSSLILLGLFFGYMAGVRRGYVGLVSVVFIGSTYLMLALASFFHSYGIETTAYIAGTFSLLIIAGLVRGWRPLAYTTAGIVVITILMAAAENAGLKPPSSLTRDPATAGLILVLTFIQSALLLGFAIRNLQKALSGYRHELSERHRAEQALRESQQRYHTLFAAARDAIFLLNGDRFFDCNPTTLILFGCSHESEILGKSPVDFSPVEQPDGQRSDEKAAQLIAAASLGTPQKFTWRHLRKDGTPFDAEVSLNDLQLNGKVYLQAIIRDISEQTRAAEELRQSEERYRSIFENAHEGIYQVSPDGRLEQVNPACVTMFGFDSAEEMMQTVVDMGAHLYPQPLDLNGFMATLRKNSKIVNFEVQTRRKDGQPIWVSLNIHVVRAANGATLYYEGTVLDITQRKKMEQHLLERSNELSDMVSQLEEEISERKRVEETLKREALRASALARISARLNASIELDPLLDTLCEEVAGLLGAPACSIWLTDAERKAFILQTAFGLPLEMKPLVLTLPVLDPYQRHYLSENIFLITADPFPEGHPNYLLAEKLGLHSHLVCWLYYEHDLIGELIISQYDQQVVYDSADLTLLTTLANQAAIAIHHARLYEQVRIGRERLKSMSAKLVDIQEAERRHLAIELHDEIGQMLTQIKMSLDRYDPHSANLANLKSASDLTIELMNKVRSLSLELRPTILDDLGLLPACLWHIERYTTLSGIQVNFTHNGVDRRFRSQVESTAYRILQESLTNAARHSGCRRVTVSLWADDEQLGLQVEDDGAGFDPAAVLQQKLTGGLSGMRERTEMCGGQLVIDSRPGAGTYLSMVLRIEEGFVERRAR